MAYFNELEEIAAFVAPGLAPFIWEGKKMSRDDLFVVHFLFMERDYKIIADKAYMEKYAIDNSALFDLEATGKQEIFWDLAPVAESKYLEFLQINGIQL
jgi:hypothetical protein